MMPTLFAKHNKAPKDAPSLNPVLSAVMNIKQHYKNNLGEETGSDNCCTNLFSCFKKTSSLIPANYKAIISWLTTISKTQAQTGYNETVMATALIASLDFLSQDNTGSDIPANILKDLIEEIVRANDLDINIMPDYAVLEQYCKDNKIDIPADIKNIIDAQSISMLIA